jgi:DNA-binding NarL/FixJ family response regulator
MSGARILFIGPPRARFPGGDLGALDFEVVGPHPALAAAELLVAEPPDAVLIDVDADPTAYDVLVQLHEVPQPCRAVVVGTDLSPDVVREAFFVGVYACLCKPVSGAAVRSALHRAAEGTTVMRRCLDAVGQSRVSEPKGDLDTSSLTPREFEILRLLLDGSTTATMAESLGVTPRTVKFHVANLLRKLGFASRLALLAKLRRDDAFAPFEAR